MSETATEGKPVKIKWPYCAQTSSNKTVLLVEDETFVREGASEALRLGGYRVLAARNAAEARDIYRQVTDAIDMLLTDVILPGESGRDLARTLKAQNHGLKILFMSAYADQIAVSRASLEEFLAKPFSVEALLGRVAKLLGAKLSDSEEDWSGPLAMPCSL